MGKINNPQRTLCQFLLGAIVPIVPLFFSAWLCLAQTAQPARSVSAASYVKRGIEWYAKGALDRPIADYNIAITFDPPTTIAALSGLPEDASKKPSLISARPLR